MDSSLITVLVTSLTAAGSTSGVAITALLLLNKRIDRVEAALDRLTVSIDARFESVDARLEFLTGSMHEIDEPLSIHRRSRRAAVVDVEARRGWHANDNSSPAKTSC